MKTHIKFIMFIVALLLLSCSNESDIHNATTEESKSTEFITLNSGKVVERRGDHYFFQGDISLSDEQLKALDSTGNILDAVNDDYLYIPPTSPTSGIPIVFEETEKQSRALGLSPSQGRFWAMARYTFARNISPSAKYLATKAIEHIEKNTNVRFYNATGEPTRDPNYGFNYPYIEIGDNKESSTVSWSKLGRIGGKQELKIAAFANVGTVIHEFCHALGMMHEQNRYDRDNYVNVLYENIVDIRKSQFAKERNNYYIIGTFDFNSIMLYDSYSFSKNGKPTMTKKDGSTFYANRTGLSDMDRRFLNTFYIPYIGRKDVCVELDKVVYKSDNTKMTEYERVDLERRLNQNRCSYPLQK